MTWSYLKRVTNSPTQTRALANALGIPEGVLDHCERGFISIQSGTTKDKQEYLAMERDRIITQYKIDVSAFSKEDLDGLTFDILVMEREHNQLVVLYAAATSKKYNASTLKELTQNQRRKHGI